MSGDFQSPDPQSEANRKLLANVRAEVEKGLVDVRAKAEKGDVQSQYALGRAFALGILGVTKQEVEAANWYRKAAEQNHARAQYNLGVCYNYGHGVAKDLVEAVKWYGKAAEQNDAAAQFNLGVHYAKGQGVAKNYVEAYQWWLLAAGQGYEDAKKNMPKLGKRMSPEQIAEGQNLARNFKPR